MPTDPTTPPPAAETPTHTPGMLTTEGELLFGLNDDDTGICLDNPADARRLAACWNILDGIPTEELSEASLIHDGPTRLAYLLVGRSKVRWPVIAAAPDMLAALEQMQKSLNGSAFDQMGMLAAHRAVDAAIAKARGDAPAAPTANTLQL